MSHQHYEFLKKQSKESSLHLYGTEWNACLTSPHHDYGDALKTVKASMKNIVFKINAKGLSCQKAAAEFAWPLLYVVRMLLKL